MNEKKLNRINNKRDKYNAKDIIVFIILHSIPFLAFFTGATVFDWVVCAFLYFARMFWITGGYHRYFAHRSYKTSRWFQFVIAFSAQTSLQKGALWWAANHRVHHKHSDHEPDPHSNFLYGFIYSHLGWILQPNFKKTNFKTIADFAKFKELRWLNRYHLVPPITLGIIVFVAGGLFNSMNPEISFLQGATSALLIGFFASTIILYHGTYSINSLMHMIGSRRYETTDKSRNNLVLALITLGEGWHNNHHHYAHSTRQGFFWWEIDITYYILKCMSWVGLVWDLREPPKSQKYAHKPEMITK